MKKRYCECGRELEKRQHYCSERLPVVRHQINVDKAMHTYRQTQGYRDSEAKSNQKKVESGYCREYDKTEKRRAWRREYEKTRLEYKREWQRARRAA